MVMDENERMSLARRVSPYGLATRAPPPLPTDGANGPIQQRWQRLCEQHGAAILGIRDVPTNPREVQLDSIRWELGPLGADERTVPA